MREIGFEERKKLQLDILKEVDFFCNEHNLTYYLSFGTLIGAVRHKGYIPWDDDVDIMMPRKDYEQLVKLFPSDGNYRFLTHHNTKNYPYAFGKIVDVRTVKNEPIRPKYQVIGLDIDVFPIDNYPDDLEEAKRWSEKIAKTQKMLNMQFAQFAKGRNLIRTILRNVLIAFRHLFDDMGFCSVNKIVIKLDNLSQKYNSIETNYCGVAAIMTYGVRKRNRKEVFCDVIKIDFEGEKFHAPVGYDEYLSDIYGDYMQLPPENKRKTHHRNKVYWK